MRGAIPPLPNTSSRRGAKLKQCANIRKLKTGNSTDCKLIKGKVKVNLSLCLTKHHAVKTYWEVEVYIHTFLTSSLDGGEWSASRPGRFTPREKAPGTHWTGGSVSPRAILDAVVKRKSPSPRRESNPRTPIVQPVGQRYTD
jgi:hypothetical protein